MEDYTVKKITEKSPYKFINSGFVKKLASLIKAGTDEEKIKLVRAKLRKISTSALPIKFYKKFEKLEFNKEILSMHRSTRERLAIYPELINKIKDVNAQKILDLGCGFNLLALFYFGFIPKEYVSYDLDNAVVQFVNRFASEKKINAKAECKDILETEFEPADLCFALKVFDALEDVERNITKNLLEKLKSNCKHIIASFSSISLSGRGRLKERVWFEKILNHLGLNWKKEVLGNETFYFIGRI
jgi:2-polyprenyl-3-methyl-5-hydroxy-6-metoxy-1,4-benzoquinol methylase